jgi:CrcB protein
VIDARGIVAVALGAAIGGVLRYVIGQIFLQRLGAGFPYGTMFINVSGCFLIGIIAELAATRAFGITTTVRLFAATGILGGYTTFSTFSLDALTLFGEGAQLLSLAYMAGSVILGFFASYAGFILARLAVR